MEYFGLRKALKVHSLKKELLVGACFSSDIMINNGSASQESFKIVQRDDLLIVTLIDDEVKVKLKDKTIILTECKEYSFNIEDVKWISSSGEKLRLKKPIKKIEVHKFNFIAHYLFALILFGFSIFIGADFLPQDFKINEDNRVFILVIAILLVFKDNGKLSLSDTDNQRKVKLFNFILFSGAMFLLLPILSIINIHINDGIGILELLGISSLLSFLSIYILNKYKQSNYQKFSNFLLIFLMSTLISVTTFKGKDFKTIKNIEEKHLFIQSEFNIEEKFKAYENEFSKNDD